MSLNCELLPLRASSSQCTPLSQKAPQSLFLRDKYLTSICLTAERRAESGPEVLPMLRSIYRCWDLLVLSALSWARAVVDQASADALPAKCLRLSSNWAESEISSQLPKTELLSVSPTHLRQTEKEKDKRSSVGLKRTMKINHLSAFKTLWIEQKPPRAFCETHYQNAKSSPQKPEVLLTNFRAFQS